MRTRKRFFWGGVVILMAFVFVFFFLYGDIKIYPMTNVDGWKRVTHFIPNKRQKEENFILYNHLLKSETEILDKIIEFSDQTIHRDTIEKYPEGYYRVFYKRSLFFNKSYKEAEDGSDVISDHNLKNKVFYHKSKIEGNIVYIKAFGKRYKIPINEENWKIITSLRQLQKHPEYLYSDYSEP